MTIIIPYTHSAFDGEELRYALRSIEANIKNAGNIILIGDKPEWFKGEVIPQTDLYDAKFHEVNIYRKLAKAFQKHDKFLYWMDDVFCMVPHDANKFPDYGTKEWPNIALWKNYAITIENTKDIVGRDSTYFDVHTPMVLEERAFTASFKDIDWYKPNGYCIKTIYGNKNYLAHTPYKDIKLIMPDVKELPKSPFISLSDKAWAPVQVLLERVFPNKSKYEK